MNRGFAKHVGLQSALPSAAYLSYTMSSGGTNFRLKILHGTFA